MLDPHEDVIDWHHLPDDLLEELREPAAPTPPPSSLHSKNSQHSQSAQNLQTLEKVAIEQALQASQGNISQAARALGISRQTLYRKILPRDG